MHWIERPGPDQDRLAPRELLARLGSARGFRPDVASLYLEFPAGAEPDDAECAAATVGSSPRRKRRRSFRVTSVFTDGATCVAVGLPA